MSYYNQFKKIISYLNYIFGIYLWVLIIYAFLRWTGLIKRVFLPAIHTADCNVGAHVLSENF